LTLSEREEISRGIVAERSIRSMASLLGRSPSTVSREVCRNGGYDQYRAVEADEQAWVRARRPKRCKLADHPWLRQAVARKLRLNWSPEQIAGWLKRTHPREEIYQVSHETIYRSLFVQARGVLKKELVQYLRSKRTIRRSKHATQKGSDHGQIKNMISISERPASVEDRAVPGHWEGDLISGSKNSHIATLVERHTRYVMLVKVANKETQTVVSALAVGHLEAKDLHIPIRGMKDTNKAQQERYKAALPNLIYTNCLDWDFYRDGELLASVTIADFLKGTELRKLHLMDTAAIGQTPYCEPTELNLVRTQSLQGSRLVTPSATPSKLRRAS
jgi:IS30 family transposase